MRAGSSRRRGGPPYNVIGDRTRIHGGGFLASATLGNDVFCGPSVVFTDPHPPCPRYRDCVRGPVIGDAASIGGGVTLLPGVVIGAGAGRRDAVDCFAGIFERAYAWTDQGTDEATPRVGDATLQEKCP